MTSILGKYELHEPLGRGGFGTVYRARDTLLNVPRAVKLLHPALVSDPEFIARFRLEAQIAARLEHPNIVPVYDLGELDGRFFLAMRLLPGGALKDRLAREGRLPYTEAVRIISQVAAALDFAYQSPEKLIHRDVKPGNILLEADGTARLADFGFAKALEGEGSGSLSSSGGLVGTLAYLAPEIWNNQPASPASDQYSLACVFYELITGQSLFGGDDSPLPVVMKRHLDPLALPRQWPEGVPAGVARVLSKALAKTPAERYTSAGEFVRGLEGTQKVSEAIPLLAPLPALRGGAGEVAGHLTPGSSPLTPIPAPILRREKAPKPSSMWYWLGLGAGLFVVLALLGGIVGIGWKIYTDSQVKTPTTDPGLAFTRAARTIAVQLTQVAVGTPEAVNSPTLTRMPSATPVPPTATDSSVPCDRAGFVDDITIEDNTEIPAGTTFVKTWRLRNTGTCTWTSGYRLVFYSGEAMSGPVVSQLTSATVPPGSTIDVSVTLVAPTTPGAYRGEWRLRNEAGATFGVGPFADQSFWVRITSVTQNTLTNTPTTTLVFTLAYDFIAHGPDAVWRNATTDIPWGDPVIDSAGVAVNVENVRMEDNRSYPRLLVTYPQRVTDGMIVGRYPAYTIQANDHFRAAMGMRDDCGDGRVRFELHYVEGGITTTLGIWVETCDGRLTHIDINLSALVGHTVQFELVVLADGSYQNDYSMWISPRIER